jgi:predicted dehydrogenase
MSDLPRRTFLMQSAAGLAGAAALSAATGARDNHARANDANSRLRFGLIGCGGRGTHVARLFLDLPNVELAYVCDLDQARLDQAMQNFASSSPQPVGDLRRILDDKDIDAVLIATPNHWHAPAGILACDAGKHVYVEKPCSHNIREGRLLVEAARRNQRVVQHGTQVRSTPTIAQAVEMLHEGAIGQVLAAKTWNIQRRGSIGRAQPSDPPAGFDYDNWVGPATMVPFQANCFHGTYNWFYHFGSGDMGNDGVHDIDYCRWGLGVETHPSEISAAGGKFMFDDDQQYPDTQQVTFVYPGDGQPGSQRMLIYEQRLWSSNYPYNCDSGVEFYGTAGQMFLSRRGKLQVLDERNQKIEVNIPLGPQHDAAHVANFVEAVRTGITPNAEIEVGHLTASLCHLGNIATRLGRSLKFDPQAEQFIGDDEANRLVRREYRDHWGRPQNV